MGSFMPIYVSITAAFACLMIIAVIYIRSKKGILNESGDIIDVYVEFVKRKLARSKTDVTCAEYISLSIGFPIAFFIGMQFILNKLWLSILIAVLGYFIPDLYLYLMKEKNEKEFEARYLRCLSQLSSSLRSGLSVEQAVEDVCNCSFINDTLKEEFLRLNADLKFKVPMDEAFRRFAERTNSNDAKDVATALTMQAEVGGNESKVVNDIANNISARTMLRKEVKALFMDTTLTILVMEIMPVVIVIGLMLYAPDYLSPFFENWTMRAVFVGLWILMIIGSFVSNKMAKRVRKVQ